MERTGQARASGAEVLYAQAGSAWVLYLQGSEASKRAKGQDARLRAAEDAAAFMVGRAWGAYSATEAELLRIRVKKSLDLPLTKAERATWTLYGPKD